MRIPLLCLALMASNFCSAQWTRLDSGTDASFRGVSAVDATVCWVSGSKGTVLRTTDAGAHWTKLPVPNADKLDFRDVEAFDANTAIIMSAGPAEQGAGKVFKTTDAGAHWKEVLSTDRKGVFLDSMAFWNKKDGIVFSDPVDGHFLLWTTNDGGDSWRELQPQSMPGALPTEGAFAASGTAIAVAGKNDVWFGTGGAAVARIFHSSDRGKHWTVAEVPIAAGKASAGVFGVAFTDSMHGVAVGGDYLMKEGEVIAAAYTADGGKSWKTVEKKMPPMQGVAFERGNRYIGRQAYSAIGNALAEGSGGEWKTSSAAMGNAIDVLWQGDTVVRYVVGPKGQIFRSSLTLIH
jgi:photosystem II stability/assembly factor-like uncharacterized protein